MAENPASERGGKGKKEKERREGEGVKKKRERGREREGKGEREGGWKGGREVQGKEDGIKRRGKWEDRESKKRENINLC